jgi:hypothetical protein
MFLSGKGGPVVVDALVPPAVVAVAPEGFAEVVAAVPWPWPCANVVLSPCRSLLARSLSVS